jgi:predicted ATPase
MSAHQHESNRTTEGRIDAEPGAPMQRLTRFYAEKLFGYLNQSVVLATEGVTILHGANGSGKTTLLRCLADVSEGRWNFLVQRPLEKFGLDFDNGSHFEYYKAEDGSAVKYSYRKMKSRKIQTWTVKLETLAHLMRVMDEHGPYMTREWASIRRGRGNATAEDLISGVSPDIWHYIRRLVPDVEQPPEWLVNFRSEFRCTLIEEQRLIKYTSKSEKSLEPTRVVSEFSSSIVDTIKDVSRLYGEKSQQLDRTFPQRLVNMLTATPPDAHTLQAKYNELEERRSKLEKAGLIGAEASMMQLEPDSLGRVEVRRLLSIYADDVTQKLSLFNIIYRKITLFEDLIQEYFARKVAKITRKGIAISSTVTSQQLDATALSSGEQHIFVLFFRLIFNEPSEQHLVLIDEPELSLHPRWQLRFVDDLERIKEVSPLDFILASHSPQIFQGHLDLGRDLIV